jgi:serine/threonine protein kinase
MNWRNPSRKFLERSLWIILAAGLGACAGAHVPQLSGREASVPASQWSVSPVATINASPGFGLILFAQVQPPQVAPPQEGFGKGFAPLQPKKKRWGLILGGIGGGIFLIVLIVAVAKGQKGQKRRSSSSSAQAMATGVLDGYRLQNLMMTGQTSQVWEVVEIASGRHFAMKLLLPEKSQDQEHRHLLLHEAEVGIKLAHPNIIKIAKFKKDPTNPYIVMEFFPAGNLKLRIMHKKWDFIKEKAHSIFKQAATGLAYMNASGWVHRDVKPDNILVNSAGEVRLIDFALAERVSKGGMFRKRKGQTAGTRSYMSPEQVRGEGLDGRADVYSFGATCFEVVTGRPPFRADSPVQLLNKQVAEKPTSPQMHNPDVSDEFAALILRMLSKKKEDRPRDFHEVLMKLQGMQIFKPEIPKRGETA